MMPNVHQLGSRGSAGPAPNAPAPAAAHAPGPAQAPRASAPPAAGAERRIANVPDDDERTYRETVLSNTRYFPFEGGYEETQLIVTARTYLDNPVGGK